MWRIVIPVLFAAAFLTMALANLGSANLEEELLWSQEERGK